MREIKFRARNANLPRCWIYGYFIIEKGACFIINDEGRFQVISGTESQFTSFKDRNEKEIYEEDIIKDSYGNIFIMYMRISLDEKAVEVIGNTHENPELLKAKHTTGGI